MIYIDVFSDEGDMNTMLKHAKGIRQVPVILDQGNVVIGFNGKS